MDDKAALIGPLGRKFAFLATRDMTPPCTHLPRTDLGWVRNAVGQLRSQTEAMIRGDFPPDAAERSAWGEARLLDLGTYPDVVPRVLAAAYEHLLTMGLGPGDSVIQVHTRLSRDCPAEDAAFIEDILHGRVPAVCEIIEIEARVITPGEADSPHAVTPVD